MGGAVLCLVFAPLTISPREGVSRVFPVCVLTAMLCVPGALRLQRPLPPDGAAVRPSDSPPR